MYACICMYTRRRQIVDEPTADVLLNWQMGTREKERGSQRERARERLCLREKREIRQSWLKSIVAVQVFVCTCASLSLCVCVCVCMCDSAWNVWKNAANDGNGNQTTLALPAVVYTMWNSGMSKYLLVAWRLLRCCRVVVVAFAPDTRRLRRHTLQLNTMTWYWLNCFRCRLTPYKNNTHIHTYIYKYAYCTIKSVFVLIHSYIRIIYIHTNNCAWAYVRVCVGNLHRNCNGGRTTHSA